MRHVAINLHYSSFSSLQIHIHLFATKKKTPEMTYSTDEEWLEKCQPETLPVPPFDRYIYMLEGHVVKKQLKPGELGFDGYQPDLLTLSQRDENELRTLEIVRQYTNIPVPKLVHQGNG